MAKKYKQSKEDRMHESEGMERRLKEGRGGKSHHSFVSGHDPEVGRRDFAGMPREVVMSEYPPSRSMRGGELDDSISEIDAIQMGSDADIRRHLSNQK